jgi:hypothetical protein
MIHCHIWTYTRGIASSFLPRQVKVTKPKGSRFGTNSLSEAMRAGPG